MARNSLRDRIEALSEMLHEASFAVYGELHDRISVEIKGDLNVNPVFYPVEVCQDIHGQIFVRWYVRGFQFPPSRATHKALGKFCERRGYTYAGPDTGIDLMLDDFKEIVRRATGSQKYVDEVLRHVEYSRLMHILDDTVRPTDVINSIVLEAVDDHVALADYTRRMNDIVCKVRSYLEVPAEKGCCTFNSLPVRWFTEDDWKEVLETD